MLAKGERPYPRRIIDEHLADFAGLRSLSLLGSVRSRQSAANRGRSVKGPRIDLSALLAAGLGLAVALSVTGMAVAAAWNGVETRSDAIRRTAGLFMRNMEMLIEQHMQAARHQTDFVARMLAGGDLDPASREDFTRVLRSSLAAAPQIVSIGFVTPALDMVQVERRGDRITVVRGSIRNDDPMRAIYRTAVGEDDAGGTLGPRRENAAGVWGGVTWHTGLRQATVTYHSPVSSGGVVFAAITVSSLSRFLGELDKSTGATSFLLYDRQKVMAHPSLVSKSFGWLGGERPLPAINDVNDPLLAAAARPDRGGRSLLQAMVADAGGRRIRAGEDDYVYFSRQIPSFADKPLTLGIFVPSARFVEELERLKFFFLLAAAFIIVGMLIAWRVGRWLAKPAREVAAGASRVSTLDLGEVREIPPIWVRELNDAAGAFNRMLFALRWFESYVPKALVRRMIRQGDADHLRSTEREVTVLFTDIQGFTRLSERMSAEEVASFLNGHFALMSRCIEEEGGTIDKYIGDGLMAFWGAPDDASDHALRAVRAALAIREAVKANGAKTRIRVGIHTGPAVAGNIGGADRLNYTIVGDTVNIAARLEGACKALAAEAEGVAILVSEATSQHLPKRFRGEDLGAQALPGREEKVRLFRV